MIIHTKHIILKTLASAILIAAATFSCGAFPTSHYASHSRLAEGKWVKIKVTDSGIYSISQSDIAKWGFSKLANIHIYGYGGAPISESLVASDYIDDLPQVPIVRGNNKIYFYAQGPTTWQYNSNQQLYIQAQHPYATSAYYFVTEYPDEADAEFSKSNVGVSASNPVVSTFTDRTFHEQELVTPGETGRRLLGEDFKYNSNQTFKFSIPDYVSGTDIKAYTCFAANTASGDASLVSFKYNGTQLVKTGNDKIDPISTIYQHIRLANSLKTFSLTNAKEFSYTVSFTPSGVLNTARLDFITVNYTRNLALTDGKLAFRHNGNSSQVTLCLKAASAETHVWDITNSSKPLVMNTIATEDGIKFSPAYPGNREYIAFNEGATFPSPTFAGAVANQNIHSEAIPDMIIITPSSFNAQAQRIADLHASNDGMRVLVVNQDMVFNEFSSGTPDGMAYRKLCKTFYDRGTDAEGHKLKYLLLFGSGSYDNRQITDIVKANAYPMLLTYQSVESTNENSSFVTDDIFVMLDDNTASSIGSAKCSIAVGRMPVKSVSEAKSTVDKLYKYVNSKDYGAWKTNAIIVADDENEAVHMEQAESIIKLYNRNGGKDYMFNRVYIDAYDAISSGGGRISEVGRAKMFGYLDEGALWLGYIGHANPTSWTAERLLTYTDMNNMFNRRLPFLFAATCEFFRYDSNTLSGGEIMYLNSQGGIIAGLSSARLAFIPNNGSLNNAIAKYAFARDTDGKHYSIGEFIRLGKNDLRGDDNKLRYVLFGDPAMKLKRPEYEARLETINGYAIGDSNMPAFQARQSVTFSGNIIDANGKNASDFNGSIISTLYDAEQSVVTKGYGDEGEEYVFQDRSNKLAIAYDSVQNGKFSIKVTIPSELSATESFDNYSPARINLYAFSNASGKEAIGSNEDFYIYGYDESVKADTIGPEIKCFGLNSENFKDGDNVNESPLVIASIFDKDGINFSSGGIGHEISLQLDGKTSFNDVSAFFTPSYDSNGNAGTISYNLSNLTAGTHTLRLKVWDVFNNSSEKTITFNVVEGLKPDLYDVYTISNPASVDAVFYLKHNRPDAVISVTLQVYDLMGRLVWSTSQTGKSDLYTSFPITWNLCDIGGRRVPRGIYVYRASISTDGVQQSTKAKKLAVTGD